jgi:hypothetical protein
MTRNENTDKRTDELSGVRKQELLAQIRRLRSGRKRPKRSITQHAAGTPYRTPARKEPAPKSQTEAISWLEAPSPGAIEETLAALPKGENKVVSKAVNRAMTRYDHDSLYNLAMGLPSRVRSFVKRVWKKEDKFGERWDQIAYEMAPAAAKILDQRLDLVLFFGLVVDQYGMPPDDQMVRMTAARSECDALLTLYCHYFTIGMSAHIASTCYGLKSPNSNKVLGGLIDVIDFGRNEPSRRKRRLDEARAEIDKSGWKLPTREHLK